ncbi:MAG: DsbA family protein, partial [Spirochaetota bacterium]
MSEPDPSAADNPTGTGPRTLTIDVWADFVCPWCYLGERRFFLALSQFAHAPNVVVRRHPFELDTQAESCGSGRMVDAIEKKYDIDSERAHALEARLAQLCSEVSLEYSIDRIPANTLDAHRLIALAGEQSRSAGG